MLSREDNALLCQVGPGTPMGAFMRRFWTPVLLSRELPEPDCPPVRVRILGEDLVAFRDSDGRVGLLDEYCPHRRASLYFGRNEERGLRCVYHGWKFDVSGRCVDMPSEPAETDFKHKVRLTAYPTEERGGIVWAYMGPADGMGAVPDLEWMHVPDDHRYQSRWLQDANYAQLVEGEIDSAHVSFLHSRIDRLADKKTALTGQFFKEDTAPRWKVRETACGMVLGARRAVEGGRYYWRMNQWLYPYHTMIAPVPGEATTTRMWVPVDDTHTSVICTSYRTDRPCSEAELDNWRKGISSHRLLIPGTLTPVHNKDNDYGLDREAQRTRTYTGMPGIRTEDAAVTESAGPITDRSKEHLGTSDTAVIKMRQLLLRGANDLMKGIEPEAARGGALYAVRSYSVVIDEPVDFDEKSDILEAMAV